MKKGAGFVVVKKFPDGWKYLALIPGEDMQKKNGGIFDIPKGIKEDHESFWECAVRECYEESGLFVMKQDIISGPFSYGRLVVWLIETVDNPVLSPNPISGILEHLSYRWVDPSQLEINCYPYLTSAIKWAATELKC